MRVFLTSPWIPAEWVKACGHEPCGIWFADRFQMATTRLVQGVCPFAEAVQNFAASEHDGAVVFSTHCDQLRRSSDTIRREAGNRTFHFNLPATWQTPAAHKLLAAELERFTEFLLSLGGHMPPGSLHEHIGLYAAARKELAEAAAWCFGVAYHNALAEFYRTGQVILPETRSAEVDPSLGTRPRLAVVGGPLDENTLSALEKLGARVMINASETGERTLWTAPLAEMHVQATETAELCHIAARWILGSCVDAFPRPNTRLYAWLGPRLKKRGVGGIILWLYPGCDLWRAEAESLRESFGLPLLMLEADGVSGLSSRNQTRIQAFLESLQPVSDSTVS